MLNKLNYGNILCKLIYNTTCIIIQQIKHKKKVVNMTSAYDEHDDYQYLPLAVTAIRQYFQLSCTKMAQKLKVSTQCVTRMEKWHIPN